MRQADQDDYRLYFVLIPNRMIVNISFGNQNEFNISLQYKFSVTEIANIVMISMMIRLPNRYCKHSYDWFNDSVTESVLRNMRVIAQRTKSNDTRRTIGTH